MTTAYPATSGNADSGDGLKKSPDQKLLDRIKSRFDYFIAAWKDIRDEAELDMRAQSIYGPWDPAERQARIEAKRPVIHLDQLGQYTNALVNEVRLNPLAVKVSPDDSGTDNETAELTGNRIRAIEYESNAQQAYLRAFEDAATRSYGVFGLQVVFKEWDSFEQTLKVRRFANPDSVLWDPDCKEADCSDMEDAFVLDRIRKDDFERRFPDAEEKNFGDEVVSQAHNWFDDDTVQIAEYWYVEKKKRRMLRLQMPDGSEQKVFVDELKNFDKTTIKDGFIALEDGTQLQVLDDRQTEERTIKQCLTNGIEILSKSEWAGKWIPIFPVVGREKWIPESGKAKRTLESYIRQARDGQQLFDYYVTNEAESVGMVPKNVYVGYEGQFETSTDWANINKIPTVFAEVKAFTEEYPAVGGAAPLPPPQRAAYEPPIQALEIGKESSRRSIQASMGSYGATRMDDYKASSGKAIGLLDRQSDMGSYHFIDNFKTVLRHAGRCMEELLPAVETGPRDVSIRRPDKTQDHVRINDPKYVDKKSGQPKLLQYRKNDTGRHSVIIDTGPSFQSQREEATAFVDAIVQAKPELFGIIGDLLVDLKQLGPIGDAMKERLKKMLPPQLQEQNGQPQLSPEVQQQMQQMGQMIEMLTQKLNEAQDAVEDKKMELESKERTESQKIQAQKELKVAELEFQKTIEESRAELERMKIDAQLQMAAMKIQAERVMQHEELASEEDRAEMQMKAASAQHAHSLEHEREMSKEQVKSKDE